MFRKKNRRSKTGDCLFCLPEEWRTDWPRLLEHIDANLTHEHNLPQDRPAAGFHEHRVDVRRGEQNAVVASFHLPGEGYFLQVCAHPLGESTPLLQELEALFLARGWEEEMSLVDSGVLDPPAAEAENNHEQE